MNCWSGRNCKFRNAVSPSSGNLNGLRWLARLPCWTCPIPGSWGTTSTELQKDADDATNSLDPCTFRSCRLRLVFVFWEQRSLVCTAEIHAQRYGFMVTVIIMVTDNGYGYGSRSRSWLWDDFSEFIGSLNNNLDTVSLRGSLFPDAGRLSGSILLV